MSNVQKFIPKAERITAAKAETARQAVLDLDLPERATGDILVAIQRHETGGINSDWTFNMISPAQIMAVWEALKTVKRPHETRDVFIRVLTHFETNSGIVTLTRDELAENAGIPPQNVSTAMVELEKIGAIIRERVKVPGMRGRGKARYRLNPHVAWNGSLEKRSAQAEKQQPVQNRLPGLELIEGGIA